MSLEVLGEAIVYLRSGIAELLGFNPMNFGFENYACITRDSLHIPDPNGRYRVLMIYTDIIEPQIVGAPLRVVNVTGEDAEIECSMVYPITL